MENQISYSIFQFHNGTIKTSIKRPQFQFHNGTIKTQLNNLVNTFVCNFNSMMVQLKLRASYPTAIVNPYFNSMMVQLKLQLAPDDSNHRLFQFHDGTIKTQNGFNLIL